MNSWLYQADHKKDWVRRSLSDLGNIHVRLRISPRNKFIRLCDMCGRKVACRQEAFKMANLEQIKAIIQGVSLIVCAGVVKPHTRPLYR